MSDSYDDYELGIHLAEQAWEKRVVKTEHNKQLEIAQAYERGWNAALAQQEPVAWRTFDGEGGYDYRSYEMNENYDKEWVERNPNHAHWVEPLYTSPQKQWQGLTDEEVSEIIDREIGFNSCWGPEEAFARAVESKLREKNHG